MSRSKNSPARKGALEKLVVRHGEMRKAHKVSAPFEIGKVAIIYGAGTDKQMDLLEDHALRVAETYDAETAFFDRPNLATIASLMTDRTVASMVFIGHGSFGSYHVYSDHSSSFDMLDWSSLAEMADHLKTGFFEQRTCAHITDPDKTVRISLGSFVVEDQARILAPVGIIVDSTEGFDYYQQYMHQVYARSVNTGDELRTPMRIHGI